MFNFSTRFFISADDGKPNLNLSSSETLGSTGNNLHGVSASFLKYCVPNFCFLPWRISSLSTQVA
ncbi:MAG: hypothetical protein KGJ90_05950 [Patescibacteria group bacterium]|nr:hypothetical protein [Patescibacteria group bacterium]